ncbi:MAG: glycosyltransferase family 2 protein [candidate division Zixibacteria bacterium]|nr:glycosyltransferase family 2 protein [candidate division Zixibacteria bacterium]
MSKVSAVVITYNEENNIRRCLESLKFADEIIVVDSKSEDRTVSIAKEYTRKVFLEKWRGFAKQREFACNLASFEWILNVDADEVITSELAREIRKRIDSNADVDGFWIRRRSKFLGRWIEHAWQPDWVLRLFRKEKAAVGENQVHEKVEIQGKTEKLKGRMEHYPFENLSHNLKKLDKYTTLSARQMQTENRSGIFLKLLFSPILGFFKIYILKQGFRDGVPGLILSVFHSFYVFDKYAKYWELEKVKKES